MFSDDAFEDIITEIGNGLTLKSQTGVDEHTGQHLPSVHQFWSWVKKSDDRMARYKTAQESRALLYSHLIVDVAFDDRDDYQVDEKGRMVVDVTNVARSNTKINTLKWLAERLDKKEFSGHSTMDTKSEGKFALVQGTTTLAADIARKRRDANNANDD